MSILLYRCTTWTLTVCMEKSLTAITQECCKQYWTCSGWNSPQSSICTATYHPSRKQSTLDEAHTRDTARYVRVDLKSMYSCGPVHMDEQELDDLLEPTYGRYGMLPIRDVALKSSRERWMIGTSAERGSERSVLAAWHDDDDDENHYCLYIRIILALNNPWKLKRY